MMLHVACCLWDPNHNSHNFSLCYDETWVEKLYRGFKRNLTWPFRFVVFTDRRRHFKEVEIRQERLATTEPDYGCLIEPFKLDEPTIICGIDMVVVSNVDHFADYCMTGSKIALPAHPTKRDYGFINPVAFVPKGNRAIYDDWRGENDMEWLRKRDCNDACAMWPGQILSLKLNNVSLGSSPPRDARIIYMHGKKKPHELTGCRWIRNHWV
jgi:hypothetical protein